MKTVRIPAIFMVAMAASITMPSDAEPESQSFRAYGPVIERELKPCVRPDFLALNLDAGFMLHLDYAPPEPMSHASPDMRAWLETSGADLVLRRSPDGSGYRLRAYMRVCPIPNKCWEQEMEKNVDSKFPDGDEDAHELAFSATAEPATYAFRTSNDTCGLIQLLDTGPDSSGFKIRYRLSRFVEKPEPAELQRLRKRASISPGGSEEYFKALFSLATWLPQPYPDESLKILEDIKANALGDTLLLAKVESKLVEYHVRNRELDLAEQHCRTLLKNVLSMLGDEHTQPPVDDVRRMDLTSEMLGTSSFMIHQLSVASVPVAQRIRRIKALAEDYSGLQAIQNSAREALSQLSAADEPVKPEASPLKSLQLPADDSPQAIAAASKMGAETADADIKAGVFRILYYGKPYSADKPLVDDVTGYRVQIVAGCDVSSQSAAEADAYNQAMRDWYARSKKK